MGRLQRNQVTKDTPMLRRLFFPVLVIAATSSALAAEGPKVEEPLRASWFLCPAERRVRVDLDSWTAAFEARPGRGAEDVLLGRLALAPVPDPQSSAPAPVCGAGQEPELTSIDVIPVDLTDAVPLDRVVRVRYETCGYPGHDGKPLLSQRVQVLRPLDDGTWCAMGSDLSLDQPAWELPCAAPQPRELAFENVVDPVRKSIKVVDRTGACDDSGNWAQQKVAYWDASGRKLDRIFTAGTFELDGPAARERTVQLEGEFPRRIVVTERERCLADEDSMLPSPDCAQDTPSTETFSWKAGTYRAE